MNIEDKIENVLKEDNIPEINEKKLTELKAMVKENQLKPKRRLLPRIVAIASSVVVLAVGTMIALSTLNKPDEIRYSDLDDNIKQQVAQEEITNYLPDDINIPVDLLNDLSFNLSNAFIADNKILAIEASYSLLEAPYTSVFFFYSLSKNFDYDKHNIYMDNSSEEIIENKKIYTKEYSAFNGEIVQKAIFIKSYIVYIRFTNTDTKLIGEIVDFIIK